jgi:malate synthase
MQVDPTFKDFINNTVLLSSDDTNKYWNILQRLLEKFSSINNQLLYKRDQLQAAIDQYYVTNKKQPDEAFYKSIDYIVSAVPEFKIDPGFVDPEIATICSPQLVVPVDNPRFLINAINARWGRLGEAGFDELEFLNEFAALPRGDKWTSSNRADLITSWRSLTMAQVLGLTSDGGAVFKHHGLHFVVYADRVEVEAACTTIVDFEDSVAAVDAADKVRGYGNFLKLLRGQLEGKQIRQDILYTDRKHTEHVLKGRSLLLNRNVGLHMRNPMVMFNSRPAYEGIVDAFVTVLISKMHDKIGNSKNVYIVKPKLHGPEEVRFTVDLFSEIEKELGMSKNIIKLGIMDEERRTSMNLRACLYEARERVIFVNTGFLDRTGDEIHTCMHSPRPVLLKAEIKSAAWFDAYEKRNVAIALAAGFSGKAQIGKGMWAEPDNLKLMLKLKISHPLSGANTAWVPSPAAAVLHAIHYHKVNVLEQQRTMGVSVDVDKYLLNELLTPPIVNEESQFDASEIEHELVNNCQGILGYVVRWVDAGVGCSKIPDIHNVGLMEDRATLRISSQHISNWLKHGLVSKDQVVETFRLVAVIVDKQNSKTRDYMPMAVNFENNLAVKCALELVFGGLSSPNGYVAPTLTKWRRRMKLSRVSKL